MFYCVKCFLIGDTNISHILFLFCKNIVKSKAEYSCENKIIIRHHHHIKQIFKIQTKKLTRGEIKFPAPLPDIPIASTNVIKIFLKRDKIRNKSRLATL